MKDLIDRQAVLEGLASIAKAKAKSDAQKSLMGRVMFFTERLPSVSTEKTGRWIYNGYYECSECGKTTYNDTYKYCPNCGARMEVEDGGI